MSKYNYVFSDGSYGEVHEVFLSHEKYFSDEVFQQIVASITKNEKHLYVESITEELKKQYGFTDLNVTNGAHIYYSNDERSNKIYFTGGNYEVNNLCSEEN